MDSFHGRSPADGDSVGDFVGDAVGDAVSNSVGDSEGTKYGEYRRVKKGRISKIEEIKG